MKNVLFLIILYVKIYGQKSDNYLKYYQLCNQAKQFYNTKDYNSALKKYDSAFKLVHYRHVSSLLNAAVTSLKIENKKKATLLLHEAIMNGLSISELKSNNFKELNSFKPFQQLNDSAYILRDKYLSRINRAYAREADSLFYVDQVIIRNVKTLNNAFNVNFYVYASERQKYDSLNFQYLLKLIDKYGFPSEEKIGPESYNAIKLVIHHSARMPINKDKIELFRTALFKGEYLPVDFVWMYDQLKMNLGESPFFYFQVRDISKLSENEKEKIDKNRQEYGVGLLKDDKLTNNEFKK